MPFSFRGTDTSAPGTSAAPAGSAVPRLRDVLDFRWAPILVYTQRQQEIIVTMICKVAAWSALAMLIGVGPLAMAEANSSPVVSKEIAAAVADSTDRPPTRHGTPIASRLRLWPLPA